MISIVLTLDQIQLLRAGLDARLYEDSPDCYRNSGYALDPRQCHGFDESKMDDEDREQCERIDEFDALDRLLLDAENAIVMAAAVQS